MIMLWMIMLMTMRSLRFNNCGNYLKEGREKNEMKGIVDEKIHIRTVNVPKQGFEKTASSMDVSER